MYKGVKTINILIRPRLPLLVLYIRRANKQATFRQRACLSCLLYLLYYMGPIKIFCGLCFYGRYLLTLLLQLIGYFT